MYPLAHQLKRQVVAVLGNIPNADELCLAVIFGVLLQAIETRLLQKETSKSPKHAKNPYE